MADADQGIPVSNRALENIIGTGTISAFDRIFVNALPNVNDALSPGALAFDGNVYGTTWGGWLSTYLDTNMARRRQPWENDGLVATNTANIMLLNWVAGPAGPQVDCWVDTSYVGRLLTSTSVRVIDFYQPAMTVNFLTDAGLAAVTVFWSDERKKENSTPNTGTYMQKIEALDFHTFDFKKEFGGAHWDLGIFAQDVQTACGDEYAIRLQDDSLQPDSNRLLVLALKTIQELNERVKALEARQ